MSKQPPKNGATMRVFNPPKFDADGYAQGTIIACNEVTTLRPQFVFDVIVGGVSESPKLTPLKASLWTSRTVGKDKNGLWRLSKLLIKTGVITEADLDNSSAAALESLADKVSDTDSVMAQIEGLWLKFRLYVTPKDETHPDTQAERVYLPTESLEYGNRVYVDLDSISVVE